MTDPSAINRENAGPLEAHRALVAKGAIADDPAQRLAVEKLQILHRRLNGYVPRDGRSFLARIGFKRVPAMPEGLYIYGGVGRGKSMLMDLFFHSAPVEPKRRVHFNAFMIEVHSAIFAFRQTSAAERAKAQLGDDPIPPVARQIAQGASLLCFDEFQVSDVADAMILSRLFTALFDEGVVVVATSNRAPDQLYLGGLNRPLFLPFIDLIQTRLDVLHLDGQLDYRVNRLAGRPVYFAPLGPDADRALDAAFRDLTDQASGAPVILDVQGHHFTIPQMAKGVGRGTFDDFCAKTYGAADYLAMADLCHTVILDHIPALSPARRNEARRLVLLIDSLYEAKRRLICSAQAEPGLLYPQGDGSFEFARTASRLEEMRSSDWAADWGAD
jgi:cell division protein ZapE